MELIHLNMARSKLPEQVKKLRGTSRKCREVKEVTYDDSVIVSIDDVKVPSHLGADAKKIYRETITRLVSMKMLLPIDEHALCLYANAMATAIKMQRELDKEGYLLTIKDELGDMYKVQVNPMVKVLKDAVNTANAIGSQFGWSPVSRIKLAAIAAMGKEDKKDDFNGLLNG